MLNCLIQFYIRSQSVIVLDCTYHKVFLFEGIFWLRIPRYGKIMDQNQNRKFSNFSARIIDCFWYCNPKTTFFYVGPNEGGGAILAFKPPSKKWGRAKTRVHGGVGRRGG